MPMRALFFSNSSVDDVTSIIFLDLPVPLSMKILPPLKSCATNKARISMSPEGDRTIIAFPVETSAAEAYGTNFVFASSRSLVKSVKIDMSSTAIFLHKDLLKKKTVFLSKSFRPSSTALWIILKSISLFSLLRRKPVKSCGTFISGLVIAYRSLTSLAWRSPTFMLLSRYVSQTMKIVVYREGADDIIQDDSSLTVDAEPTKLRMAATRSSMYVFIFPAVGSWSWLTIFRSSMVASYSLLLAG